MSSSLEVLYYGKGFSKGKNGNQKPLSSITIAKGEPVKSWLHTMSALKAMGYDVDSALLKHLFKSEWENLKEKI